MDFIVSSLLPCPPALRVYACIELRTLYSVTCLSLSARNHRALLHQGAVQKQERSFDRSKGAVRPRLRHRYVSTVGMREMHAGLC